MGRKFAVELRKQRHALGKAQLGTGGDERGIRRRRGAVDDEARARQRLPPLFTVIVELVIVPFTASVPALINHGSGPVLVPVNVQVLAPVFTKDAKP
jgi:hypothetical protein